MKKTLEKMQRERNFSKSVFLYELINELLMSICKHHA